MTGHRRSAERRNLQCTPACLPALQPAVPCAALPTASLHAINSFPAPAPPGPPPPPQVTSECRVPRGGGAAGVHRCALPRCATLRAAPTGVPGLLPAWRTGLAHLPGQAAKGLLGSHSLLQFLGSCPVEDQPAWFHGSPHGAPLALSRGSHREPPSRGCSASGAGGQPQRRPSLLQSRGSTRMRSR